MNPVLDYFFVALCVVFLILGPLCLALTAGPLRLVAVLRTLCYVAGFVLWFLSLLLPFLHHTLFTHGLNDRLLSLGLLLTNLPVFARWLVKHIKPKLPQ